MIKIDDAQMHQTITRTITRTKTITRASHFWKFQLNCTKVWIEKLGVTISENTDKLHSRRVRKTVLTPCLLKPVKFITRSGPLWDKHFQCVLQLHYTVHHISRMFIISAILYSLFSHTHPNLHNTSNEEYTVLITENREIWDPQRQ